MSTAAVSKICCVCGIDVSGQKRTKDARGRYYCQPCYSSAAATVPVGETPAQSSAEFACSTCHGLFNSEQVYDCGGTFVCHGCYSVGSRTVHAVPTSTVRPPIPKAKPKPLVVVAVIGGVCLIGFWIVMAVVTTNGGTAATKPEDVSPKVPTVVVSQPASPPAISLAPALIVRFPEYVSAESVVFSSDGKRVLAAGADAHVGIWDATTGQQSVAIHSRSYTTTNARAGFIDAERRIVLGQSNYGPLIFDAATGEFWGYFEGGNGVGGEILVTSRDGRRVVSAGLRGGLPFQCQEFAYFESGFGVARHVGYRATKLPEPPEFGYEPTRCADISPDGTRVATTSWKATAIWDTATGVQLCAFPESAAALVAFGPDGGRVVTSNVYGKVQLWDVASGQKSKDLFDTKYEENTALAWSHDGKFLLAASGKDESEVVLWDTDASRAKARFPGQNGRVNSLAFTPDSKRFAVASKDGTIRLFDIP